MDDVNHLVVGAFYWVMPAAGAVDAQGEWQSAMQPARYAGVSREGELLWNFIAVSGCSDWPLMRIGERCIEPPGGAETPSASDSAMEEVSKLLSTFQSK